MAFKINTTTAITNDPCVVLGNIATVAALPSGAAVGTCAYVTADDQLYYKKSTGWSPITAKYGSVYKPATNAAQIYNAGDSNGNNSYYITSTSGTLVTYCDMTNGQYMLVATLANDDSGWYYNGGYWTATSTTNEGGAISLGTSTVVTRLFYEYTCTTGVRHCLGTGNYNNGLNDSWTSTPKSAYITTHSSSNSRAQIMSWFQTGTGTSSSVFDNQPNCNSVGYNGVAPYANARWGISMNNEGDCSSNDSCAGFGLDRGGEAGRQASAGGVTWSPNTKFQGVGYIFAK
jgi:hypothetical protein